MSTHNQTFGRKGEDAAAEWYERAGYRILDRNWRCPHGEIDLIVTDDSTVIFVEVKARSSGRYGSGFDAVDWRKQERVRQLARLWLARPEPQADSGPTRYYDVIQFDVVDVDRAGTIQVRQQCF